MSELYRVLVADPPWRFQDELPGPARGAAKHYRTLSLAEIMAFSLPPLAADAYLIMWRVAAMQEEALQVVRAWGFVPKAELVWLKQYLDPHEGQGLLADDWLEEDERRWMGMGHTVRNEHEVALIGKRGHPHPKSRAVRSTFKGPVRRHSEKPDEFYALVEELCEGPYVELFARRTRPGWTCLGDEVAA